MATLPSSLVLNMEEEILKSIIVTKLETRGLLGFPPDYDGYSNYIIETLKHIQLLIKNKASSQQALAQFNAGMRTKKVNLNVNAGIAGAAADAAGAGTAASTAEIKPDNPNFSATHQVLLSQIAETTEDTTEESEQSDILNANILNVAGKAINMMNECRAKHKLIYHTGGHPLELYKDVVTQCSKIPGCEEYAIIMGLCALMHDSVFTHSRINDERTSGEKLLEILEPILNDMGEKEEQYIKALIPTIVAATTPVLLNKDTNGDPEETMIGLAELMDEVISETPELNNVRNDETYQLVFHLSRMMSDFDANRTSGKDTMEQAPELPLAETWDQLFAIHEDKLGSAVPTEVKKSLQHKLTQNQRVMYEIALRFNNKDLSNLGELIAKMQTNQASVSDADIKAAIKVNQKDIITLIANKLQSDTPFCEARFGRRQSNAMPADSAPEPTARRASLAFAKVKPSHSTRELNHIKNEENITDDNFKLKYELENTWENHIAFLSNIADFLRENADNEEGLKTAMGLVRITACQEGQMMDITQLQAISATANAATAKNAATAALPTRAAVLAKQANQAVRRSMAIASSVDAIAKAHLDEPTTGDADVDVEIGLRGRDDETPADAIDAESQPADSRDGTPTDSISKAAAPAPRASMAADSTALMLARQASSLGINVDPDVQDDIADADAENAEVVTEALSAMGLN